MYLRKPYILVCAITYMRVWVVVPRSWEDIVDKAMRVEGWEKVSDYLRELIKKDLVSKGFLGVKREEEENLVKQEG